MGAIRTALFGRQQPGGVWTIENVAEHPKGIWWVDSAADQCADASGYGYSPDRPFATLTYALSSDVAEAGDVIYVQPTHAETKSASGSFFAADIAGVHIKGLGKGAARPTFTFSHTGAAATISAASVTLENVIFVCGIDAVLAPLTISAADVSIIDVEFRDATDKEFIVGIYTTTGADRLHVDGLHYRGDIATGDGLTIGIDLAGMNDVLIENCIFESKAASTAWVNFSVNSYNVHVRDCIFNDVTTTLTKDVVDTAGSSTWSAIDCWDLRGGYMFSGGSGSSVASGDVSALAAAIAVVDEFHDVPAQNATANAQIDEVIGNKTDTAGSGAVTDTSSLIKYAKQIVNAGIAAAAAIVVVDEFHDVPAQNAVANAQINEVLGNKTDTAGSGAVTDTSSLIKYAKQLVNAAIAADAWQVKCVKKSIALTGGSAAGIFVIGGGPIQVLGLNAVVTAAVSADPCDVYFASDPTLADYATTPMCGAVDIASATLGSMISILDADASSVAVIDIDGTNVGRLMEIGSQFIMEGEIDFVAANSDPSTGTADVYLTYRPLSALSTVTAGA